MAPQTTKNQISKGAAPRAAARQKAHVQESADKLADLKARQAADAESAASAPAGPTTTQADEAPKQADAEPEAKEPTVQFVIDGKPVGATQNRLSSISRVTASGDDPRWPAPQFRAWLAEQGVTNPNHTTWEVTLPNGRKIAAVPKTSAAAKRPAAKAAAKKAASAPAQGATKKAS